MKKTFTMFLAIATLIALAVPASAKPGKGPGKAPLAGTPCGSASAETGDFTIYLDGERTAEACVDVSNVSPGPWMVTVDVGEDSGPLRSLLIILRDSFSPGDACDAVNIQRNIPAEITLEEGAPGSYVNACGLEWAEWVDGDWVEGDYVDGVYYDDVDENVESPLALIVYARGRGDLDLTMNVNLPDAP